MHRVECARMHELNAEADALDRQRKDAARYRWLRDVGDATWRPFALREGYSAEMADKAIDDAMLKTPN